MMKPISLTARLALLFTIAATLVLLLSGWMLSLAIDRHFIEQDTTELKSRLAVITPQLATATTSDALDYLLHQLNTLHTHHVMISAIRTSDTSRSLIEPELTSWQQDGHHFRRLSGIYPTELPDSNILLTIDLDITHHEEFLIYFNRLVWSFVLFFSLIMTVLAWFAARQGLAPLRKVTALASKVSADRLDERLCMTQVPAELLPLAQSLNEMLERLKDSFQRLSHFSSDIAHELRTPVNNLMIQTEVALSHSRTPEEYRDLLGSNLEEYEKLARMISDMLFIAKADNGLIIPLREKINLSTETGRLAEFFEPLAAESSVKISIEGAAEVAGDRVMLTRALSNLISNAIHHAAPDSEIKLIITAHKDGVQIAVENQGEEIPEEHLPYLFDRFYRAHPARDNATEHSGLGLAITRAIITAHGGQISVTSTSGVTRFLIEMSAPLP
ncbi:heavy metal sensor histidine kinase [Nitrincola alkalilacustris]|uniref:heavy metal sensor histidine kinase n=1 Tax=Nitrincola alkalilacustris TaxID=1571224 RepID=UPI001456EB16|nr:heavy metal sensor histidine kinase [Nitrincola alkalilacustris]